MKKREPVSHIMTPDPYVLNLNDGLSHAEILFKKHKDYSVVKTLSCLVFHRGFFYS